MVLGCVEVQVNAGMFLNLGMCSRSALRGHMKLGFKGSENCASAIPSFLVRTVMGCCITTTPTINEREENFP